MFPAILIVLFTLSALWLVLSKQGDFDAQDNTPPITQAYSPSIVNMGNAIAQAEGYGIPNAIPTMANNPGDLVIPGWDGATLGSGISVFTTANEGWQRLYFQLGLILNGESSVYNLDMTIADMSQKWTTTQQDAWAANVASYLGVPVTTQLSDILTFQGG